MPFQIVRNDITKMTVDAIVNAANEALLQGGGVCGAIFAAAGAEKLQAACDAIGGCKVGHAVRTPGFDLPAKNIIHTVGPIWHGGTSGEEQLLKNCYSNSLLLAKQLDCTSIAFPLISSGIFGYPKENALQIAVSMISDFLLHNDMLVYLVVYDPKSFALSEKLFSAIGKYIDDNYVSEHRNRPGRQNQYYEVEIRTSDRLAPDIEEVNYNMMSSPAKSKRDLESLVAQPYETFSQMLLRLIDEKGTTDVATYKRANIDRKLFSKIRSTVDYSPSKITAISFAVALELNLDETKDLLGKAGFTLSKSSKFDVILQYFIEEGQYNIFEINEALFVFDQPLLGA